MLYGRQGMRGCRRLASSVVVSCLVPSLGEAEEEVFLNTDIYSAIGYAAVQVLRTPGMGEGVDGSERPLLLSASLTLTS
jgi:hypothetical protein